MRYILILVALAAPVLAQERSKVDLVTGEVLDYYNPVKVQTPENPAADRSTRQTQIQNIMDQIDAGTLNSAQVQQVLYRLLKNLGYGQ